MSEDDFSDPYDEPSMEISIKTLTGTSFDMRVYPTDTVLDIKNKIQRVEGIPAHHQNLLFQLKELQDFKRLCDVGIVNGSQLKLVLSMRGGPISTRRLTTCDHHIVWKDLKDLIEHTREEIGEKTDSKVSVLVFKEGEVINLIRVIENEDGSYSPYADKAVSPPHRANERDENQVSFFKKITEDMEMASKMHTLKSKMKNLSVKRQMRNTRVGEAKTKFSSASKENVEYFGEQPPTRASRMSYKIIKNTNEELKRFENKIVIQENFGQHEIPEVGEIALKDKHRTKMKVSDKFGPKKISKACTEKKVPSGSDKSFTCRNLHVFEPESHKSKISLKEQKDEKLLNGSILAPLYSSRYSPETVLKTRRHYDNKLTDEINGSKLSESIAILEEPGETDEKDMITSIEVPCAETLSLSARNRVHLTQLVLQDSSDRPKSSPDLDENAQELWEIQPEPIKKNATYKVGVLKRRSSVDHNYDAEFTVENNCAEDGDDCKYKNSDYEVFSHNFYHLPQYVTAPSAIPPQYAPKDERICDLYLGSPIPESKVHRSPLYGRRAEAHHWKETKNDVDYNAFAEEASKNLENLGKTLDDVQKQSSSIERLCNDVNSFVEFNSSTSKYGENLDEYFGYFTAKDASELDRILNRHHPNSEAAKPKELIASEIKRLGIFDESKTKIQIDTTKLEDLPHLNKKRMRCGQCNKRLNITNIYNCRCGRIFCAQHRYSEAHDCKYDYKTEGRKLLEQQNPLVTASKLSKF